MTPEELGDLLRNNIPANYFYIARAPYSVKGTTAYNIFFNTRLPNSRLSTSHIANQDVFTTMSMINNRLTPIKFERPVLIDEYSRTISPNSTFNFIDLAGDFLTGEKTL